MPNANENLAPVAQADAATEPIDLAQAFKMFNQANREAAQEPVENEESVDDARVDAGGGSPEDNGSGGEEGTIADEPGTGADGASDGGSSDSIEAIDFNAQKQQLLREVQQDAITQVRREFTEQNIGYYSVAELTVRDENTGQVRFRNPDVQDERDPNYYFKSRSECQQFCTSWNQGVDFEYRKAVNEKQQELIQQQIPKVRMLDFLPRWNAMDENTKAVFDDLLQGHEIRDANGKEIGFNVDLNAVAAQAERIAKRFPGQVQQTQPAGEQASASQGATEPALDMKTGNGKSDDEREPTNIGEALKMYDKRNKGGK